MKTSRTVVFGIACFTLGITVHAGLAQDKRATYSPNLIRGKDARDAATFLLDGALQLAESGSWERIAVGRAWYLGGDKARGQEVFDSVTSRKPEGSDWLRIGRVYGEAREWDKAQAAFDRALAIDKNDASLMIEYGAFANLNGDRAKAESLFDQAFKKDAREFWHWVGAGGSYLGVHPE
jgi:tetratricopeptide (TPR) repeat protein